MCLIAFAWRVDPAFPLLVAANRDEFHARPTAPADFWEDAPEILAGRDLQAGGTWLGVSTRGRFAAVTNIRDPGAGRAAPRSRGDLPTAFLGGNEAPATYLARVAERVSAYQGFNLLVGDGTQLWYLHGVPGEQPRCLEPGIYGLSNAALDVPWPKVCRARDRLREVIAGEADLCHDTLAHDALAACVADRSLSARGALRDERLEGEMARRLSAQFIVTDTYGTRCQSTLLQEAGARIHFRERRFDASGQVTGEDAYTLRPDP